MLGTVTDWLDGNWFALLIGIFIVGMMLYGHSRGFIRLAVSFAAVLITVFLARAALPHVTSFLQEHTGIEAAAEQYVQKVTGLDMLTPEQINTKDDQDQVIAGLQIPENLQKVLKENNTEKIWKQLGVTEFTKYVADYLSRMIISYVGFAVLFFAIWILLRLVLHVADVFTMLPVIHGLNQIAGAVLGLAEALFFVWLGFLVLGFFEGTEVGGKLTELISGSVWLKFLYQNNLVLLLLKNLLMALL